MKFILIVTALLFSFSGFAQMKSENVCTFSEEWSFSGKATKLSDLRFGDTDLDLSFFADIQLQIKTTKNKNEKLFLEYFYSRSLFLAGFDQFAWQEFGKLIRKKELTAEKSVSAAVLTCVNSLMKRNSSFDVSSDLVDFFKKTYKSMNSAEEKLIAVELAFRFFRHYLAENSIDDKNLLFYENILLQKKEFSLLAQGLKYSYKADYKQSVQLLSGAIESDLSEHYLDLAKITLARSQYALGDFKSALGSYEKINTRSNFIINGLQERAYTYFQLGDFSSALGTALSLHRGLFKNAFHPEVELLAATIYYEICQYSEVGEAIQVFKQNYLDTQKWMAKNSRKRGSKNSYYSELLSGLGGKNKSLPQTVLTEWLRSPRFISYQDEMNLLLEQKSEILKKLDENNNRKIASDGKLFSKAFDYEKRKWKAYSKYLGKKEKILSTQIEKELDEVLSKMKSRLNSTVESFLLLRADVYKEMGFVKTQKEKERISQTLPNSGTIWDWGRAQIGKNSEKVEVWDDEIGAMKSNLPNICQR